MISSTAGANVKASDPPVLDHIYTVGDRLPYLAMVVEDVDLTAGYTVTAQVERPDGTFFERVASILSEDTAQVDWLDTDWLEGCSRLTIKLEDAGGLIETSGPVIVKTKAAAGATP